MRGSNAVLLFARTPEVSRSGGGDPFASLPWEDLDTVFHACAADVLHQALTIPDTDVLVHRSAHFPKERLFAPPSDGVRHLDLGDLPFGEAVQQAVDGAFLEYYHRVLVLLGNNPLVGAGAMRTSLDQLGLEDDCAVIVPAGSGGALAVALKGNYRSLFSGKGDASEAPSGGILARLCEQELILFPHRSSFHLESTANMERLREELAALHPESPGFPKRTAAAFRALEKKYRWKRPPR